MMKKELTFGVSVTRYWQSSKNCWDQNNKILELENQVIIGFWT